ncbi:MAG: C4-dicarboxylate ABC transporter substrate-binding protein [Candidatus Roseilinea sp.]|nr:MAG: C4-dicarboxylate ABC transporter substrate-binding protein [Candidatus Roseilinea sp.]
MKALLRVASFIDSITDRLSGLISIIVVLAVLAGFLNAALRYLGQALQRTLISNELIQLQWYLFSLLFLIGFPYLLKHNVNVRVDFFYSRWGPRQRALVDFLGTLLFLLPFCLLAIYVSIGPVLTSWGRLPDGSWGPWEVSSDAGGLPLAPLKSLIIVGFFGLLVQAISQLIKYVAVLLGYHEADQAVMVAETDQMMADEMVREMREELEHEAMAR